ncbi:MULTISPECIES: MXAN_5187 C-terminal domain-containing protein [unclassified Anaeromyxobacter]|uniref:MXAN_5187 C-terminal domain-containing protein n=1 Tax=unclassified Anaeromyxobacter TaxID=2620896 RepID=UPI001F5A9E34|nr:MULTISPECIES: MXAN_5187 C-terminal domain-containing protein [unclassified Anaeromyxobacter]
MPVPPKPPARPGAPLAKGALGAEDPLSRSRRGKDELAEAVQGLEEELETLKARYEQYFLGIERREPVRWREELKRNVARVKGAFTRNAGLRFRIQALHARYLSYERLWMRSAREREEGTYKRDLFKARLHARAKAERAQEASGKAAAEGSGPAPVEPAAAASPPAVPARTRQPAPARTPAPGGVGEAQLRALYEAYVAAKKQCNEDVSRLTYEAVARSVAKQVPELMTRFKARSVDFKVEVKDGRAVLKAIPKV